MLLGFDCTDSFFWERAVTVGALTCLAVLQLMLKLYGSLIKGNVVTLYLSRFLTIFTLKDLLGSSNNRQFNNEIVIY